MSQSEIISTDFLEKALGKKVESFTIHSQSDTGDNFMSILYTLDVNVPIVSAEGKTETLHLLSKCYPAEGRQEFLNEQNIFWKEVQIYNSFATEIIKFTESFDLPDDLKLPFPPMVAGNAVNFDEENGGKSNTSGKVFRPFDNYVMMVDLRKTWGYVMADRLVGLDFDHMVLAVEAQAKLHALSWAYKKHNKLQSIRNKFPWLHFDISADKDREMFNQFCYNGANEAIEALKLTKGENIHLIDALEKFKDYGIKIMDIIFHCREETEIDLEKYLRVKSKDISSDASYTPWRVVLHGDTHMNNMLFRYNTETKKPEHAMLVDFQLCKESCPTSDLAYIIYTSSTAQFRRKHLDQILNIYFEKFNYICQKLKTETLPGFTLEEFKRRFHRKKLYGLCMGLIATPIFLKERENAVQLDSLEESKLEDIFASIGKGMSTNAVYVKRITDFLIEMHDDGIL